MQGMRPSQARFWHESRPEPCLLVGGTSTEQKLEGSAGGFFLSSGYDLQGRGRNAKAELQSVSLGYQVLGFSPKNYEDIDNYSRTRSRIGDHHVAGPGEPQVFLKAASSRFPAHPVVVENSSLFESCLGPVPRLRGRA